ncbi:MAG: hypothetical protein JST00_02455 [Deltaproteobacteria bacterium]|nr:hypothetical protein [Deltaproteobacteria bacterium]
MRRGVDVRGHVAVATVALGVALAVPRLARADASGVEPPPPAETTREPWSDRVLADLNASLPVAKSDELRLNGDITAGYNGGTFGVVAHSSIYDYELTSAAGLTDTVRYDGNVSGWGYLSFGPKVRAEVRAGLGMAFYDTTSVSSRSSALFVDETSLFGRGEAMAGVRYDASERFVVSLAGGGGMQIEQWDGNSISTTSGSRVRYATTERSPLSVRVGVRLRAQWLAVPGVLSVRARFDLESLAVSRSDMSLLVEAGSRGATTVTAARVDSFRQTEVFGRLFVDLDALKLFELRPSIHGGLNTIALGDAAVLAPVIGIGIHREAF